MCFNLNEIAFLRKYINSSARRRIEGFSFHGLNLRRRRMHAQSTWESVMYRFWKDWYAFGHLVFLCIRRYQTRERFSLQKELLTWHTRNMSSRRWHSYPFLLCSNRPRSCSWRKLFSLPFPFPLGWLQISRIPWYNKEGIKK